MAINTLATATLFQSALDEAFIAGAKTSWMDANAGQVIYNGGAEVKIPKMSMDGMGKYDRDLGYVQGSITLTYGTYTLTQDRGRKFQLDAMDIDENNFVTTASSVMGAFQREQVVPEIDAYRIAKLAGYAQTGMKKTGYTPAKATALDEFKTGISAIMENYDGQLVAHVSPAYMKELELRFADQLHSITFSAGGVDTTVPSIDGVALIVTPQSRMYTEITINDGKTSGQEAGGFAKGSTAKDINFLIVPQVLPIAVTKQDKIKIFTPDENQDADAWKFNYRRFHDLWVMDKKKGSIYLNTK